MKTSLVLALLLALAVPAAAQSSMGITFSDAAIVNTTDVNEYSLLLAYMYIETPNASIGGYEASIDLDPNLFVANLAGPNGWTNFGALDNHLVGFMTPLANGPEGWVVICTITFIVAAPNSNMVIALGPSTPSSFGGLVPGFADGVDPNILVPCEPVDGIINPVVATEARSFSAVKALFD